MCKVRYDNSNVYNNWQSLKQSLKSLSFLYKKICKVVFKFVLLMLIIFGLSKLIPYIDLYSNIYRPYNCYNQSSINTELRAISSIEKTNTGLLEKTNTSSSDNKSTKLITIFPKTLGYIIVFISLVFGLTMCGIIIFHKKLAFFNNLYRKFFKSSLQILKEDGLSLNNINEELSNSIKNAMIEKEKLELEIKDLRQKNIEDLTKLKLEKEEILYNSHLNPDNILLNWKYPNILDLYKWNVLNNYKISTKLRLLWLSERYGSVVERLWDKLTSRGQLLENYAGLKEGLLGINQGRPSDVLEMEKNLETYNLKVEQLFESTERILIEIENSRNNFSARLDIQSIEQKYNFDTKTSYVDIHSYSNLILKNNKVITIFNNLKQSCLSSIDNLDLDNDINDYLPNNDLVIPESTNQDEIKVNNNDLLTKNLNQPENNKEILEFVLVNNHLL